MLYAMLGRLALAAVAVAAIAFGIVHLDSARACESAQAHPARSVDALLDDCRGALPLARGSVALLRAGRAADARRLAEVAARRQPDDYVSWLALAAVRAAAGDRQGATRARERARALNPLANALRRR
jgi:predicted Zn-dependent protease